MHHKKWPSGGDLAVVVITLVAATTLAALMPTPASLAQVEAPRPADDPVLLRHLDIAVTQSDLAEYLRERLLPEVWSSAIAKPGAIKQAIGNVYIIRRAANVARAEGLSRPRREEWEASSAADRYAMDTYVEHETEKKSAGIDWRGLARDQYLSELEEFGVGVEIEASHILISSEDQGYDRIVAKVAEVREALSSGHSFEDVALKWSEDPSAERNSGYLGYVKRGQTAPAFEKALFAMTEVGQVSDPVITPFGVHIIRYEGQRDRQPLEFESVAVELTKALKKRQTRAYRELILEPFRFEALEVMTDLNEVEVGEAVLNRMLESDR